jgi:hypothetical protein
MAGMSAGVAGRIEMADFEEEGMANSSKEKRPGELPGRSTFEP